MARLRPFIARMQQAGFGSRVVLEFMQELVTRVGGEGDVTLVKTNVTSSTDNTLPRFDGTSGDTVQKSGVTVDDSDNVTGVAGFTASGQVASNTLAVADGVSAPSATAKAQIFVDAADGDLKVIFADGVTKTIATDT